VARSSPNHADERDGESRAEREQARVHFRQKRRESESHVRASIFAKKVNFELSPKENLYLNFPLVFPSQFEFRFRLISSGLQGPFLSFYLNFLPYISLLLSLSFSVDVYINIEHIGVWVKHK